MRPKNEKMTFFPVYLFEHQNCLKILDNGKKYHTGEFGVISITGLGFSFCMSTAIGKEPLSGLFSSLVVLCFGRGKSAD